MGSTPCHAMLSVPCSRHHSLWARFTSTLSAVFRHGTAWTLDIPLSLATLCVSSPGERVPTLCCNTTS